MILLLLDYASLYPSSIIELNISQDGDSATSDDLSAIDMGWIKDKDYKGARTYDNWIYKGKGKVIVDKILDEKKKTCA